MAGCFLSVLSVFVLAEGSAHCTSEAQEWWWVLVLTVSRARAHTHSRGLLQWSTVFRHTSRLWCYGWERTICELANNHINTNQKHHATFNNCLIYRDTIRLNDRLYVILFILGTFYLSAWILEISRYLQRCCCLNLDLFLIFAARLTLSTCQ